MDRQQREQMTEAAINGFARAARSRGRGLVRPDQRALSFREFRQVVRRRRPSDLLPALAAIAASDHESPYNVRGMGGLRPWAIALIARESVLWGNEHRKEGIATKDLVDLHNALVNLDMPVGDGAEEGESALLSMLTRLVYEQFPYQESLFEELARTHAALVEPLGDLDLEILDDQAWTEVLGAPLPDIVTATFFLQVAANRNAGWVDPTWLDRRDISNMLVTVTPDSVRDRLVRLSSTPSEFREEYDSVPKFSGLERFSYNPLTKRPFVRMPDGRYLAPQPRLILRTVTPGTLYYEGIRTLGKAFARDLGKLTEHYVGRLLREVDPAIDLRPEIGWEGRKSIDWFLTLPSSLVMFEVKSERYRLHERAAVGGFLDRITTQLNKAHGQLAATSAAIDSKRPEFAAIDSNLPRRGVIVTAEPFHLANSAPMSSRLDRAPFPVIVASMRDLEHMAGLAPEHLDAFFVELEGEFRAASVAEALSRFPHRQRPPLMEQAWDAYPWFDLTGDH